MNWVIPHLVQTQEPLVCVREYRRHSATCGALSNAARRKNRSPSPRWFWAVAMPVPACGSWFRLFTFAILWKMNVRRDAGHPHAGAGLRRLSSTRGKHVCFSRPPWQYVTRTHNELRRGVCPANPNGKRQRCALTPTHRRRAGASRRSSRAAHTTDTPLRNSPPATAPQNALSLSVTVGWG